MRKVWFLAVLCCLSFGAFAQISANGRGQTKEDAVKNVLSDLAMKFSVDVSSDVEASTSAQNNSKFKSSISQNTNLKSSMSFLVSDEDIDVRQEGKAYIATITLRYEDAKKYKEAAAKFADEADSLYKEYENSFGNEATTSDNAYTRYEMLEKVANASQKADSYKMIAERLGESGVKSPVQSFTFIESKLDALLNSTEMGRAIREMDVGGSEARENMKKLRGAREDAEDRERERKKTLAAARAARNQQMTSEQEKIASQWLSKNSKVKKQKTAKVVRDWTEIIDDIETKKKAYNGEYENSIEEIKRNAQSMEKRREDRVSDIKSYWQNSPLPNADKNLHIYKDIQKDDKTKYSKDKKETKKTQTKIVSALTKMSIEIEPLLDELKENVYEISTDSEDFSLDFYDYDQNKKGWQYSAELNISGQKFVFSDFLDYKTVTQKTVPNFRSAISESRKSEKIDKIDDYSNTVQSHNNLLDTQARAVATYYIEAKHFPEPKNAIYLKTFSIEYGNRIIEHKKNLEADFNGSFESENPTYINLSVAAAKHYAKANYSDAQAQYANFYMSGNSETGETIEQDSETALEWFSKAQKNGSENVDTQIKTISSYLAAQSNAERIQAQRKKAETINYIKDHFSVGAHVTAEGESVVFPSFAFSGFGVGLLLDIDWRVGPVMFGVQSGGVYHSHSYDLAEGIMLSDGQKKSVVKRNEIEVPLVLAFCPTANSSAVFKMFGGVDWSFNAPKVGSLGVDTDFALPNARLGWQAGMSILAKDFIGIYMKVRQPLADLNIQYAGASHDLKYPRPYTVSLGITLGTSMHKNYLGRR